MNQTLNLRGSLLAKNTALNLVGQIVPALVALAVIPYIVRGLGIERFGVLSLAWVVLAYLSFFDLGLGRATTRSVAAALGDDGDSDAVPGLVWTSLAMQGLLGLVGGAGLAAATPLLVERVLNVPPGLVEETKLFFYVLSASSIIVLWRGSLRGLLEATQRFDLVNAVRVPSNTLIFLLPALAIVLGFQLPGIGLLLLLSIIATALAYLVLCLKVYPSLRRLPAADRGVIRPLLTFGGWVTVSSLAVPFLVYSDRFLIGALASLAALGYYAAAYEAASRLQLLPWSFGSTLFPAFSTVTNQREGLHRLYARSLKYMLLVMVPVTLVVVVFAKDILRLWLGVDFADEGTRVLQVLVIGMALNALSQVPANLLDGVGRPDLRAKLFWSYGVFYIALAWLLISTFGIMGAALAWAIRGGAELALFFAVSWRLMRFDTSVFTDSGLVVGALAGAVLTAITFVIATAADDALLLQSVAAVVALAAFGLVCWRYVLDQAEKSTVTGWVPRFADRRLHRS